MEWVLLMSGCAALGFAAWMVWQASKRKNAGERAEVLKIAAAWSVSACVLFAFSGMYLFDIGANLTISQLLALVKAVGILLVLMGIWAIWYTPRHAWRSYEEYRDASSLPTLRASITVVGIATGIFLAGGGLCLLTLSNPLPAFSVVMGVISAVGALVALGAALMGAWVDANLRAETELKKWREQREGARR